MRFIGSVLGIVFGFAFFWWLVPGGDSFGFFEGSESDWVRLSVAFLSVVLGVILGSFYRQLKQLNSQRIESLRSFFANTFRSVDMWLGLVGSPVLFALLLRATDGISVEGMVIIGLENGFCCLLLLNGLLQQEPSQVKDDNS